MTVRQHRPTHYYITIGSHEPAMRIADGDTVVTTTLDAAGFDASGASMAPHGNPQTGPFYVEGAEPGDTLPSTSTGWSRTAIRAGPISSWQRMPSIPTTCASCRRAAA